MYLYTDFMPQDNWLIVTMLVCWYMHACTTSSYCLRTCNQSVPSPLTQLTLHEFHSLRTALYHMDYISYPPLVECNELDMG